MSLKTQTDILHAVRETGSCSIADLAHRLAVSTETIRRNVKPLIEGGMVLRFHGGVMVPDRQDEAPFQRRLQLNRGAKRIVANLVRDMVRDGDSLILDNGATSAYVAEALSIRSDLVVVTNSVEIAWRLASRNGNRVFMAGGELGGDDAAAFGAAAIAFIRQFQVRYAVISVAGIAARGDLVPMKSLAEIRATLVRTTTGGVGRSRGTRAGSIMTAPCEVANQSRPSRVRIAAGW